ncbi:MAG: agmatine deiminase family protein [Gammaproteobacteria bacterium]|nr:agmatine deiminase family protein [Gammaproteobacteria bacterium]
MNFTPKELGFSMPPESARHECCWMAWPTNRSLWGDHIQAGRVAYAATANTIVKHEPVYMIVRPDDESEARKLLDSAVSVLAFPLQDGWMRDIGPTFVVNSENHALAGIDWGFNGWGTHFRPYDENAAIAREVLSVAPRKPERFVGRMILEGGSIHIDGDGTLVATEECLLNGDRNPHLTKAEIEQNLYDFLGVEKVIWLPYGLVDDLTDGHVDNVACFAAPGVAIALVAEESDKNYPRLQANLDILRSATDAKGRSLEVHEIQIPEKQLYFQNLRLPMSYVNFYLANNSVILPVFDDVNDDNAKQSIQNIFPNRTVETVPGTDITYGGGCVHCITQQQPAP